MASWSPSQSDPLTVSYMCQRQSSSPMLPSDADIPPCAATVCERVGKTLVMQAVFSPAWAQPSAARRPEPPAPTTTTSKRWSTNSYAAMGSGAPQRDLEDGHDGQRPEEPGQEQAAQQGRGLVEVRVDVVLD